MSTHFITLDSAPYQSSPGPEAPSPDRSPAPAQINRLSASDFFAGKSLAELAREQGVGPVKDIAVFAGGIPEYEDVDELLAQLEAMRAS